jgi:DNA-binding transcriptional LysR family regulator
MDPGISLEDIEAFVAVTEHGSVSRAAERLRLAQPVVSRRVQRLEAALGVELLDRSTRPSALTSAGTQALGACRMVLRAIGDLRAVGDDGAPSGEVRLGIAPSLADIVLTAALGDLRVRFPQVTLRVSMDWTPQLLHQLRMGVLDVGVVQLPAEAGPPHGLDAQPLKEERLHVVAPAAMRLGEAEDFLTLSRLPWVLSPSGDGGRVLLESIVRRAGATLHIAAELQGYQHQAALVARGVGLGLLPTRALTLPETALLRRVAVSGALPELRLWLVRRGVESQLAAAIDLLSASLADAIVQEDAPSEQSERSSDGAVF